MAFAITFGGLVIDGISAWSERRESKLPGLTFPRRHGTITQQVAFSGPRIVTVGGRVWKDSEAELLTYFDELGARLQNVGRDRLLRHNNGRYLNAICSGTAFPNFEAGQFPSQSAGFSIEFLCDDPWWYSDAEQTDTQNILSSPHTFSITNNGKLRAPISVEIKAVGTGIIDVKLTNTTLGLFMRYAGAIGANDTLIIDSREQSVQNAGANGLNAFEGSFFGLEPGVNNFEFQDGGTVLTHVTDVDLVIRHREVFA